ncbi:MAG: hypothetical protein ACTTJ6_09055 [Treponema sp.]
MSKEDKEELKKKYDAKAKEYDDIISQILIREEHILGLIKKEEKGASYKRLVLVDDMIFLVTAYLAKYSVSVQYLGGKNENILNDARKALYKIIIYLEEIVTNYIDASYSEYEDKVQEIGSITQKQRYYLIRKIGFVIWMVVDAYGTNTKWKWSFAEIMGRYATVAKNIVDLKFASAVALNPRDENYDDVIFHLRLVKTLLESSAEEYRKKYEIATNNIEDVKTATKYLSALRRIHVILGENKEAEDVKTKLKIWNKIAEKDKKNKGYKG